MIQYQTSFLSQKKEEEEEEEIKWKHIDQMLLFLYNNNKKFDKMKY
jgi:hypothetical protein